MVVRLDEALCPDTPTLCPSTCSGCPCLSGDESCWTTLFGQGAVSHRALAEWDLDCWSFLMPWLECLIGSSSDWRTLLRVCVCNMITRISKTIKPLRWLQSSRVMWRSLEQCFLTVARHKPETHDSEIRSLQCPKGQVSSNTSSRPFILPIGGTSLPALILFYCGKSSAKAGLQHYDLICGVFSLCNQSSQRAPT